MKKNTNSAPEVRKTTADQTRKSKLRKCTATATNSPPAKRLKHDNDPGTVDIAYNIRGQHAAELLLELPYTVLQVPGDKKCVLGFIVQATKVSTCQP